MDQTRGRLPSWARLAVVAVTIALLLLSATSAAAARRERVGDRIYLADPPTTTYPANTAFHIWHGFGFERGIDRGYGRYEFQLEVDGVATAADFTEVTVLAPTLVSRVWVFNFPDGLSGTHTFTAHWVAPDGEDEIEVTVDFT